MLSAAGEAVRLRLRGANPHVAIEGLDRQPGVSNYLGRRPLTGLPQFARVRYRNAWPGIDVVFYGSAGQLEYDFIVAPRADPRRIRLEFEGARQIRAEGGDLVLRTAAGELRQRAPAIYQAGERVRGGYMLHGRQVAFELGAYDRARALVIDPVLTYNARFGARAQSSIFNQPAGLNGLDRGGAAIAVDGAGNAYVVGAAYTADFPTTTGVFQPNLRTGTGPARCHSSERRGHHEAEPERVGAGLLHLPRRRGRRFRHRNRARPGRQCLPQRQYQFHRLSHHAGCIPAHYPSPRASTPDSSRRSMPMPPNCWYATYLGGTGSSTDVRGIAIDNARNMYVTGVTVAQSFPVTPGAFRTVGFPFTSTAFVTKINAAGTALVYSTFLGFASGNFSVAQPPLANMAIAVDSAGNAYVAGATGDRSFPTTSGSFQPAMGPPSQVGDERLRHQAESSGQRPGVLDVLGRQLLRRNRRHGAGTGRQRLRHRPYLLDQFPDDAGRVHDRAESRVPHGNLHALSAVRLRLAPQTRWQRPDLFHLHRRRRRDHHGGDRRRCAGQRLRRGRGRFHQLSRDAGRHPAVPGRRQRLLQRHPVQARSQRYAPALFHFPGRQRARSGLRHRAR